MLADAQAGKTATLTLNASFLNVTRQYVIGWLPGKDHGAAQDEQILIATHTDAMSLVEEDGALGMLGIMRPQGSATDRPRKRSHKVCFSTFEIASSTFQDDQLTVNAVRVPWNGSNGED